MNREKPRRAVYLIAGGEYSNFTIHGVCLSKRRAEALCAVLNKDRETNYRLLPKLRVMEVPLFSKKLPVHAQPTRREDFFAKPPTYEPVTDELMKYAGSKEFGFFRESSLREFSDSDTVRITVYVPFDEPLEKARKKAQGILSDWLRKNERGGGEIKRILETGGKS